MSKTTWLTNALWRSCIGLLFEPIALPVAGCGKSLAALHWTFACPIAQPWASGAGNNTQYIYIAPRPSASRHDRTSSREHPEHGPSNTTSLYTISKMEDIQFQNNLPAALSLNETLDRNTSKPQGLARKNWDDLKSTIRELYLDQGQTLKQIIKYLEEHHGFRPT